MVSVFAHAAPDDEMDTPNRPWVTSRALPVFQGTAVTTKGSRAIHKDDLMGKVWVADFIFTNCGTICPRMSQKMRQLQDHLAPNIALVSFTIDPENDTVKVLQSYAREYKADPKRWVFVRMSKPEIKALVTEGFNRAMNDKATYEMSDPPELAHNSRVALVDAKGNVRAFYDLFGENAIDQIMGATGHLVQESALPHTVPVKGAAHADTY